MRQAHIALFAFTTACAGAQRPAPQETPVRQPPPRPTTQPAIKKLESVPAPQVIERITNSPPVLESAPQEKDMVSMFCHDKYGNINAESDLPSGSVFYRKDAGLYLPNEEGGPAKKSPFLKCVFSASNQGDPVPLYVGCAEEPGDADILSFESMGEWSLWISGNSLHRDIVTQQETAISLRENMFCHAEPMSSIPQYAKMKRR